MGTDATSAWAPMRMGKCLPDAVMWPLMVMLAGCPSPSPEPFSCPSPYLAGLPCGPAWSPCCRIVDGVCTDPLGTPSSTALLTDQRIRQMLEPPVSGPCLPTLAAMCNGDDAILLARAGDVEWTVDVYDTATREWEARYWRTDEMGTGPCGNEGWIGEVKWKSCAQGAVAWLEALDPSCFSQDTGAVCDHDACYADWR